MTIVAPPGLTRCFYADNGSAAVEVALKMSFHYWRNVGQPSKRRFMTLANSYHGETLGALAVGDVELYKQIYQPLLMDVITVPSPDCHAREPGESWESHSRRDVRAHGSGARAARRRSRRRSSSSRSCSAPAACACITPCTSRCCARPATGTACT